MGLALLGWSAAAALAGVVISLLGGEFDIDGGGRSVCLPFLSRRSRPPPPSIPHTGPTRFPPGACDRLEAHLAAHLVGQGLAVRQLVDAMCDHVASLEARDGGAGATAAGPSIPKPLVLSAHGPPGVGKTLAHALTAAALYAPPGTHPADPAWACPGRACPGYRVFFGLDFGGGAPGAAQLAATRRALASHAAAHPAALIVVEEYDKLDCAARGLFRAMLAGSGGGRGGGGGSGGDERRRDQHNASSSSPHSSAPTTLTMPDLSRAIVILESNTGYAHLASALAAATEEAEAAASAGDAAAAAALATDGDGRALLAPEAAARLLKDAVYAGWAASGCEAPADTVRALAAVDFFLPFLPLHAAHVRALLSRRLAARAARAEAEAGLRLVWEDGVLDFLAARIDVGEPLGLSGGSGGGRGGHHHRHYPIEGAREVSTLVTRYVTRAVRAAAAKAREQRGDDGDDGGPPRLRRGTLVVAADGRGLEVIVGDEVVADA
jgi:hypothetical protein